jgi:hypothetical protein
MFLEKQIFQHTHKKIVFFYFTIHFNFNYFLLQFNLHVCVFLYHSLSYLKRLCHKIFIWLFNTNFLFLFVACCFLCYSKKKMKTFTVVRSVHLKLNSNERDWIVNKKKLLKNLTNFIARFYALFFARKEEMKKLRKT